VDGRTNGIRCQPQARSGSCGGCIADRSVGVHQRVGGAIGGDINGPVRCEDHMHKLDSLQRKVTKLQSKLSAIKSDTGTTRTVAQHACFDAKSAVSILNQEFGHALTEFDCTTF
jgi:hypothetical protein